MVGEGENRLLPKFEWKSNLTTVLVALQIAAFAIAGYKGWDGVVDRIDGISKDFNALVAQQVADRTALQLHVMDIDERADQGEARIRALELSDGRMDEWRASVMGVLGRIERQIEQQFKEAENAEME